MDSDRAGRVIRHYCRSRIAPRIVEPNHPVIRFPSPPSGDGVAGTYAGRARFPATSPSAPHIPASPERYGLLNAQLTRSKYISRLYLLLPICILIRTRICV